MKKKIYIVNGANLDMLGVREPSLYGSETLQDIEAAASAAAAKAGYETVCVQKNGEGELTEALHAAYRDGAAVILNAGAYTHYSYAIADAVKMLECPVAEVHMTNIFAREPFRAKSVISPYASVVICGAGSYGYVLAVEAVVRRIAEGEAK